MMFPKPQKPHKKYSQKLADKYFSLLIRHRGHCEAAGFDGIHCGGSLQCAHIVGRANKRLRYDEKNALCLCAGHHYWYTNHNADWYWVLLPDHFASQFYYVREHKNDIVKNNARRLREIIEALDQQLTTLQIEH
jgi:hypothetical protein